MNKRLTILVLIAAMVLLGFVGDAMATKPVKVKGEKPFTDLLVTHNRVKTKFDGTVNYIIHGMFDSDGELVRIQIHLTVDGESKDDYKIRGAFNEKFDVDKGEKFTKSFVKTFTCISAGEGASFKVTLKFPVTGDVIDPKARVGVKLEQVLRPSKRSEI